MEGNRGVRRVCYLFIRQATHRSMLIHVNQYITLCWCVWMKKEEGSTTPSLLPPVMLKIWFWMDYKVDIVKTVTIILYICYYCYPTFFLKSDNVWFAFTQLPLASSAIYQLFSANYCNFLSFTLGKLFRLKVCLLSKFSSAFDCSMQCSGHINYRTIGT